MRLRSEGEKHMHGGEQEGGRGEGEWGGTWLYIDVKNAILLFVSLLKSLEKWLTATHSLNRASSETGQCLKNKNTLNMTQKGGEVDLNSSI